MQVELTAESILREVSKYVNEDVSYIEALVHYAELHGLEDCVERRVLAFEIRIYGVFDWILHFSLECGESFCELAD